MSEYQPREHDHLVEPFFGGIARRSPEPAPERAWRLWSFLGACAIAVVLRLWQLAT